MRDELQRALDLARTLPVESLADFLGQLEVVRVTALSRLNAPALQPTEDTLLSVAEASKRLHVSKSYLYTHNFPFTRRVGRKLLFSNAGLSEYLRKAR
jgi:hypothetical protein